jgi:hypothetical protein
VSSFPDLTNIFEETFVNQFSRRREGDTFDSAEREAWAAELKHITASQFGQSTFTADQIRNTTQNRAKSEHARKFARGVNRIHTDDARKPSSLFIALARTISYKGSDDIDALRPEQGAPTIHMHFDSVFATTGSDSIASRLRAAAKAQAADGGDATDEALALSAKCMRYINGRLYRVIKCVMLCTTSVRARAPEAPVQGLRRRGLLHSRAPEGPLQGLRHGLLHSRAREEPVQGLRHGPLRARAPEAPVQGLPVEGNRQ